MICDKITYKGHVILTIYHQNIDDNVINRYLKRTEKIGKYNLTFTETFVQDIKNEDLLNHTIKEEGLLEPNSPQNPYGCETCAYMIHYIFANKPKCILGDEEKRYSLKISVDEFLSICKFIKKYTGIDIKEKPMVLGDIFIFKCYECNYKCVQNNSIVLENLPDNSTVIIHFKNDDLIVSSKIIKIDSATKELVVASDKFWNSHDIEIFIGDKTIYLQKDISYIRHISLHMSMRSVDSSIKLKRIGTTHTTTKEHLVETSHIGEPINEFREKQNKSSHNIKTLIEREHPDDQVFFIKPNEFSIAKDLIIPTIESAKNELWIFDSYLTENDAIDKTIDWLRIISICNIDSSNFIFYYNPQKTSNLTMDKFLDKIKNDNEIKNILARKKRLCMHFYQVASPIHDRFVLVKNKDEFQGLSIGTSFNSLERNHYCIHKLSHAAAKKIFLELTEWIDNGNLVLEKEI